MKWLSILALFIVIPSLQAASPRAYWSNPVTIEVVGDNGRVFPLYQHSTTKQVKRAYLWAQHQKNYKIRMQNKTAKRIGVLLAVDGRNIISGKKSYLKNTERMYVLEPYKSEVYKGWRTSASTVNRFYFSTNNQSYAAAWGDKSALGVIAIATFEEQRVVDQQRSRRKSNMATGFGREEKSAMQPIAFMPKNRPNMQYFMRYMDKTALCEKAVLDCPRKVVTPQVSMPLSKIRWNNKVSVSVVSHRGGEFPLYEYRTDQQRYLAYMPAKRNKQYALKIRNNTNQRVGVVIAVDGRNVISGKKSYIKPNERMYVLDPHQTEVYNGWRSDGNHVNEFEFKSAKHSYAGAWDDYSAIGTIAIAVYPEQQAKQQISKSIQHGLGRASRSARFKSEAGTGYGNEVYSPSVRVSFKPQQHKLEQYVIKYEWRKKLCKRGIIQCNRAKPGRSRNSDGFATPPPQRFN